MPRRRRAHGAARSRAARASERGSALRILAIALSLLFGQTTLLLHLLVVPHTTCEHGELIELRARPRAAQATVRAKQAAVSAATPGGNEHEHCSETARPHRVDAIGPAVSEASLLCVEPAATLGERREARPVNPLSLAPKSSPPSA
jgi:hypothetical protein